MEAASRPQPPTAPGPARPAGALRLLRLLDEVHANARDHGRSVSALAVRIGRHMNLDAGVLADLWLAGTLHDVGKLDVPAQLVEKAGPLSAAEWEVVRRHPAAGERLLRPHVPSRAVLAAVRWHHERWDGRGYPDGLEGPATPVAARVVSAADAFTAMVEHRPYRPPLSRGEALTELERNSGSQFDPGCVSALRRLIG